MISFPRHFNPTAAVGVLPMAFSENEIKTYDVVGGTPTTAGVSRYFNITKNKVAPIFFPAIIQQRSSDQRRRTLLLPPN